MIDSAAQTETNRDDISRSAFTVREIAARNGLSHPSVYKEIAAGRLRTFKVGRARRISTEAEQEWIELLEAEECEKESAAE